MQETINIVKSGISVDIEKLKKIILDEWLSGDWYNYCYNRGYRGENLYRFILTHLTSYADAILDELVDEARKKLNHPNAYFDCRDNYPKSDVRSIGFEVLLFLERIGWDPPIEELTTDDIPMILEFLDTPPEKSLEAWDRWEKYWANLDYAARRKKLLEN